MPRPHPLPSFPHAVAPPPPRGRGPRVPRRRARAVRRCDVCDAAGVAFAFKVCVVLCPRAVPRAERMTPVFCGPLQHRTTDRSPVRLRARASRAQRHVCPRAGEHQRAAPKSTAVLGQTPPKTLTNAYRAARSAPCSMAVARHRARSRCRPVPQDPPPPPPPPAPLCRGVGQRPLCRCFGQRGGGGGGATRQPQWEAGSDMLPPRRRTPAAVSVPAEKERARNWEERKQQSNWAQSCLTHGSETSPNRKHNNTQGNHEV